MSNPDAIAHLFSSARPYLIAGSLFLSSIACAGNRGQIECVAPNQARPISLTMTDAEIRYALTRGLTSFIIDLAAPGQRRCFTLVNENMAAGGKLLLATSNERLAVDDPKWSAVEGAISFRHKRLFALSLLGVDAKFVKLTFQVDDLEKITRAESERPPTRLTAQP